VCQYPCRPPQSGLLRQEQVVHPAFLQDASGQLACLVADGKLSEGQLWRQEGIVGTMFEGSVRLEGDSIIPSIRGSAYVTAESVLILDPDDPFREGFRV